MLGEICFRRMISSPCSISMVTRFFCGVGGVEFLVACQFFVHERTKPTLQMEIFFQHLLGEDVFLKPMESLQIISNNINVWYIYLHEWLILMVYAGKNTSPIGSWLQKQLPIFFRWWSLTIALGRNLSDSLSGRTSGISWHSRLGYPHFQLEVHRLNPGPFTNASSLCETGSQSVDQPWLTYILDPDRCNSLRRPSRLWTQRSFNPVNFGGVSRWPVGIG